MTQRSADTISPRITTSNNNNLLALGGNIVPVSKFAVKQAFRIRSEKIHCKINT